MTVRRSLFTKYVTLIVALVSFVLVASSAIGLYFSSKENIAQLEALQHEKALAAATRIELYIKDIEHQMAWTTLPQIGTEGNALDLRRYEYLKLLRQAPAISELVWVDKSGREQLRVSRLALDVMGGGADMSAAPYFKPGSSGIYYGPVYFRKETEPYMTIARPAGGAAGGVIAAEVNLKFVWDVVKEIDAGKNGAAYVVNSEGTLIAHPDISLVLQKTSLAALPQVAAVMRGGPSPDIARDPKGGKVLSAQAPIPTLAWHVFVEAPLEEAFAPLYASIYRTGYLLIAGLVLSILASLFLARRMVRPIRALQAGTAKLGAGELDQRIEVNTGDELEALAGQFNTMAEKLGESYADLEKKVEDRTHDLAETLAQQTATSEVLKVISGSMTDVQPVFAAIVDSCSKLFGGGRAALWLVEGDMVRSKARAGQDLKPEDPRTGDLKLDHDTAIGTCILDRTVLHMGDVAEHLDRYPTLATRGALALGFHSLLIAPLVSGGKGIGALIVLRRAVGDFSDKEKTLLSTFADQATIAIQNVRLFNETREALEQQTATSEVLRVISGSMTDVKPVFEAIVQSCSHLVGGSDATLFLVEGDRLVVGSRARSDPDAPVNSANWLPLDSTSVVGSSVAQAEMIHLPDLEAAAGRYPKLRQQALASGYKSMLAAPLLREGRGIGVLSVLRRTAGEFSEKEQRLLKTFADQASIAIENVRLFNETQEALEQQTATAEVLEVISTTHVRSDVKPVFQAILEKACALCDARFGAVGLYDGELYHNVVALAPPDVDYAKGPLRPPHKPEPGAPVATMIAQAQPVHVVDGRLLKSYLDGTPAVLRLVDIAGARSWLNVPLLRDGRVVGGILVYRTEVRPFTDKQIELVSTFARQAVIAIENVRLFNETQEALDQQTATAEILQVISRSPTDVQPVLDAVAERAEILCDGGSAVVYLREGDILRRVAMHGPLVSQVRGTQALSRESVSGRAVWDKRVVNVEDIALVRDEYPVTWAVYETLRAHGVPEHHSMIAVPLVKDGQGMGAIMVRRAEVRTFTEKQIALLQVFADQVVIAIENVRLFNEIQESLERQTATANVLRVISQSNIDTMPVFEEIVRSAKELGDAVGAAVFSYDGEMVDYVTSTGLSEEWKDSTRKLMPRRPDRASAGGRAIIEARTVKIEDIEQDREYEQAVGRHSAGRRLIAVPMLLEGKPIGSINVTWRDPGPISDKHVRMLQTFADQAVIAVTNVRLFREIQEKSAQLEIANKHKSEFLANMSHELRTPLNAIIGFSEVLQDSMFGELNEEQLEFIKDIHESGKHLLSLINDILDLSKVEAGRMELMLGEFDLPSAVSNALALVKERANRHSIRLTSDVDPALGTVRADERKLKQILLNLLSNAVKFTPEGGAVKVSAHRVDGGMEIAVADTGVGIAPEDREAVFEEFRQVGRDYTRKAEGTGLGLALTRKFVQLHGGNIRLESELGKGSTFTVFIPEVVTVLEEAHGE